MTKVAIVIEWHEKADEETVHVKTIDYCEAITDNGLMYGITAVYPLWEYEDERE